MIALTINGERRNSRSRLTCRSCGVARRRGLMGTKFGCGMALCGACTVHIDGKASGPA